MEPTNIIDVIFSFENPIIYAIIFTVVLIISILRVKRSFISPLAKNNLELEIKNNQLLALFATMDPDPILRIDSELKIIDTNNSAKESFNSYALIGKNIKALIPDYEDILVKYTSDDNPIQIDEKYYSLVVKDIQHLNFSQLYMHDITKRVKHEEIVEDYQKSLKKLKAKVEVAHEEEKQRIGRELHDSVGQQISVLKLEMQYLIQKGIVKTEGDGVEFIIKSLDELGEEVRDISHQLRPRILNELGLKDALTSLIGNVTENTNIDGYISSFGESYSLEASLELNIYRICQEAINNIIKHSCCSEFAIKIYNEKNNIRIIISDNGKGFTLEKDLDKGSSSLGLLNMKERAEAFNGSFLLELMDGEGAIIYLNFRVGGIEND